MLIRHSEYRCIIIRVGSVFRRERDFVVFFRSVVSNTMQVIKNVVFYFIVILSLLFANIRVSNCESQRNTAELRAMYLFIIFLRNRKVFIKNLCVK